MKRALRYLILIISVISFLFLFSSTKVKAQSCTGNVICGQTLTYQACVDGTSCSDSSQCAGVAGSDKTCQVRSYCDSTFQVKSCSAIGCPSVGGCGLGSCSTDNQCSPSGPSCTSDGSCQPSGGSCCSGSSYADSSCSTGRRCGTFVPGCVNSGGSCASGQTCCSGLTCTSGTCQASSGGGACGWCAGDGQCTNAGGTPVADSSCSNGFCCTGVTGGGGVPTPTPSPCGPLGCLNSVCGGPCIVTADCAKPTSGAPVWCKPNSNGAGGTCVNANCPNNTISGSICGCSGGLICGQQCAGGCTNSSTCRFIDAPGGFCGANGSNTYCVGDTGNGFNTFNADYVTPKCTSGDTGNSMLRKVSTGQTTGFTQADINATCPPPASSVNLTATNPVNGQSGSNITIQSGGPIQLSWNPANVTSCTASSSDGTWTGAKSISGGTETLFNIVATTTYTITCTGSLGDVTSSVTVNVSTPQCTSPTPIDPPVASCSPTPTGAGTIVWKWNATPPANQYEIFIYNATTNNQILDSGLQSAATFGCASSSVCSYTTLNMAVGSYYSRIQAAGLPACSTSNLGPKSSNVSVTVCPAVAWWQCGDGDIYGGGNVTSLIPYSCTTPSCTPSLITNSSGVTPGVVTFGGNLSLGTAGGNASSTNWNAKSVYSGKQYDYSYFSSLIPPAVLADPNFIINSSTANNGTFNSGGSSFGGYKWFKRVGDLNITSPLNINDKIILFVEGNLTISDRVILQKPGSDFFLSIVQNDTNVDPTVSNGTNPVLNGIFFSGGSFNSGAGTQELVVNGSVVADTVNLQRDLGAGNQTNPGEYVVYDPAQMVNFPKQLSRRNVIWKEVAP